MYAARKLGPDAYGKFAFALVFPLLFMILADLGIHQLLIREIARRTDQAGQYLGNALFIKFFLAVFTGLMIGIVVNLTGKSSEELVLVYIMGGAAILGSFSELFKSVFQAFQKMTYDVIATVTLALVTTLLGILVLFYNGHTLALSWAYFVANVVTLIYCIVVVSKYFTPIHVQVDMPLIKFLIKEGYPFGVSFFFSTLYAYVDTVMLSLMTSDKVVGWYNTAYRLIFAMGFIPQTTMKAVFPALSRFYKKSLDRFEELFKRSFKTLYLLGFSIATLLCCLSTKIIYILYGDEYAPAASVLRILVWSTALIFITNVMTRTTRASNRQHFSARVVASSAFLNILLNFLLIPRMQHQGAALATLLTEANTMIFHFIYLSKVLVKPPLIKLAPKIILINGVTAAFLLYFKDLSIIFLGFMGLIILIGMVIITRYFTRDEIEFLRDLLKPSKTIQRS
jgi:O-antigen/teichoic acid export membrane protein